MTDTPEPDFLDRLPVFSEFEDVANPSRYMPVPEGWLLAVADVVSSGTAIAEGKYKMVNMAGAAVIAAVLNALGRADHPFVFGGDGAVIAVPGTAEGVVRDALANVATWIDEDLNLRMRVALVPVAAARAAGVDVGVARFRTSDDLTFAMFAGGGSAWAEAQMKAGRFAVTPGPPGSRADLSGLSCRWNPLDAVHGVIVSIIAVQRPGGDGAAFRSLVSDVVAMASAFGGTGNPLPEEGPRPVFWLGGMDAEVRAQAPAGKRFMARLKVIFEVSVSFLLHRTGLTLGGFDARDYGRQLARNTDFRKFDDGLKMTVDVDEDGCARIEARLQQASDDGVCDFGIHRQTSALVTCIVPSILARDHMHFIDGGTGGYAQAAGRMKAKMAQMA